MCVCVCDTTLYNTDIRFMLILVFIIFGVKYLMPEAIDGKCSKIRIQINYVGFNVLLQWGFFSFPL